MKTFGQRIRELREEKDFSLRELAKQIQVTAAFLSDIELGRRYPSEKNLQIIARALDTSVDDLRTYDTRTPVEELKRLAALDPTYGVAFRKIKDVPAQDLLSFVEKQSKRKKS